MEVFTNNRNSRKYQIGYALSGGFIKGFAHLGVMQALLEHEDRKSTRLNSSHESPSRMPSSA